LKLFQSRLDLLIYDQIKGLSRILGIDVMTIEQLWKCFERGALFLFGFLSCLVRQSESTVHTPTSFPRSFLPTAGTVNRTDILPLLLFYVFSVKAHILKFITFFPEIGEISLRMVAPSFSSLSILDSGLRHPTIDEPPGIRFPEISRGDSL
jgi:hypothetical protein